MGATDVTGSTAAEVPAGPAVTAQSRSVEIDAATLVYRRFGDSQSDAPPLCLQHFRGNVDTRTPATGSSTSTPSSSPTTSAFLNGVEERVTAIRRRPGR